MHPFSLALIFFRIYVALQTTMQDLDPQCEAAACMFSSSRCKFVLQSDHLEGAGGWTVLSFLLLPLLPTLLFQLNSLLRVSPKSLQLASRQPQLIHQLPASNMNLDNK